MDKIDVLRNVPLFRSLTEADMRKLANVATEEKMLSGSKVFRQGDKGDSIYVIKYGTVKVQRTGQEDREEIARMGPGQPFGEMALIDNEPRSATIEAVENIELVQIKRKDLEDLLAQDISLGMRVYQSFTKHLNNRLRQTTADLAFMREKAQHRNR